MNGKLHVDASISRNQSTRAADEGAMLVTIQDRRPVVVFPCPHCRRSVIVRWPETLRNCDHCGERCHVPANEKTEPS